MERIRIKMLVALLFLCLSATAQTEYSGIAGASPRLVRAAKQAANKQANHSTKPSTTPTASKPKTANEGKVNSKNDNYAPQSNNNEGGETEVKEGFKVKISQTPLSQTQQRPDSCRFILYKTCSKAKTIYYG